MRFTQFIGSQSDYIEYKSIKPKDYPCPQCGQQGKRKQVLERRIPHVAALHRRSWIVAEVGVYQARCGCCKYFQAAIPGVPYQGRYSYEVRNSVANALIRDRMPYRLVIERMQEDHLLELSLGYIHACFVWAHEQINMEEHWDFVRANFSGVLCIDEVHDSGRTMLFATAPLNDFTVSFKPVERNDQEQMDMLLQGLTDRGLAVRVAITDGSPLDKDSRQRDWADVEHQLCLVHVIKEVNKLMLDGGRTVKNRIKRQGNTGRKRRPGRPRKTAPHQRQPRNGMSKKAQATFIGDHQSLIGRTHEDLSAQDKDDLAGMVETAPALTLFRPFTRQFDRRFEKGITKPCARYRRTQMVNHPAYQAHPFLAKALKKLANDRFEKMIVFRRGDTVERTNHHVERNNRVFRMLHKTRDKRRKNHTIEKALDLEVYARMLTRPLYQPSSVEVPILLQKKSIQKMAA